MLNAVWQSKNSSPYFNILKIIFSDPFGSRSLFSVTLNIEFRSNVDECPIDTPRKGITDSSAESASVAQLGACPTGDQEVAGSTAGLAIYISGACSWNIFYGHPLPSLIQKGRLSGSGERMCTIFVNSLED